MSSISRASIASPIDVISSRAAGYRHAGPSASKNTSRVADSVSGTGKGEGVGPQGVRSLPMLQPAAAVPDAQAAAVAQAGIDSRPDAAPRGGSAPSAAAGHASCSRAVRQAMPPPPRVRALKYSGACARIVRVRADTFGERAPTLSMRAMPFRSCARFSSPRA